MKFFCTQNCNECILMQENPSNKQLAFLLNFLVEKYGDEIISDVNKFCPNLTCCPICRTDDFCHCGCDISVSAICEAEESKQKKYHELINEIEDLKRDRTCWCCGADVGIDRY